MEDWSDARAVTAKLARLKAACPEKYALVRDMIIQLASQPQADPGTGASQGS